MTPRQSGALLCVSAFFVSAGAAQTAAFTPAMKAQVDAAVTQVLQQTDTPSAQVGIVTRKALAQLARGTIDRALINANLEFFFTPQVLADYKASLAPLGQVKTIETLRGVERSGMDGWSYRVTGAAGKAILVFVYVTRDGKLDQLLLQK